MQEGLARLRTDYERLLDAEQRAHEAQLAQYQTALAEMARSYPSLSGTVERPLTIPAIFRRIYDENFLSDYLAYILDPRRNGIGDEPLLRLLELVVPEAELSDIETVEIVREFPLGSGRIDLLIDICDSAVVGIEAKLWSLESTDQTAKYARALRREFPDRPRYNVFLTPSGTKPKSPAFCAVSHRQLLHTLREVRHDWQTGVLKSVLWEDFLTHLEVYVVMDNQAPVLSEKTRLYIANQEMLRDLEGAYDKDSRAVFDYVVSRLEARMPATLSGTGWKLNSRPSWSSQWINKSSWSQKGLNIHYEFYFSRDLLLADRFPLALEVETSGSQWNTHPRITEFIDFLLSRNAEMEQEFEERGIVCRPPRRRWALAWKEYSLDTTDLSQIDRSFVKALEELAFLVEPVDRALADFAPAT